MRLQVQLLVCLATVLVRADVEVAYATDDLKVQTKDSSHVNQSSERPQESNRTSTRAKAGTPLRVTSDDSSVKKEADDAESATRKAAETLSSSARASTAAPREDVESVTTEHSRSVESATAQPTKAESQASSSTRAEGSVTHPSTTPSLKAKIVDSVLVIGSVGAAAAVAGGVAAAVKHEKHSTKIAGTLLFTSPATKKQIETATKRCLANQLSVDEGSVTATATESRRLLDTFRPRRPASTWSVAFSVGAPAAKLETISATLKKLQSNTSTLRSEMVRQLKDAGASKEAAASLDIKSFEAKPSAEQVSKPPASKEHKSPNFLAQSSHFGKAAEKKASDMFSGNVAKKAEHFFGGMAARQGADAALSTSSLTTAMPSAALPMSTAEPAQRESVVMREMFPKFMRDPDGGSHRQAAAGEVQHGYDSLPRQFRTSLPEPVWMVVIGLGIVGGSFLVAGMLHISCCGRRKRHSRSFSRSSRPGDSEGEEEAVAETEAAAQRAPSATESEAEMLHLLPPLKPLLPTMAPVPSRNFGVAPGNVAPAAMYSMRQPPGTVASLAGRTVGTLKSFR